MAIPNFGIDWSPGPYQPPEPPAWSSQVHRAIDEKDVILATSPLRHLGWDVIRRLKCLSVIEEELEGSNANPGQLANIKALIAAYQRTGTNGLKWGEGPITYWVRGSATTDMAGTHFSWAELLRLQRLPEINGGVHIEGVCTESITLNVH